MSLSTLFMDPKSDAASLSEGLFSVDESIYDPHLLKAIFIAGSGGAGKGAIGDAMFAGTGLKVINQDRHLERFMKDAKLPLGDVGKRYDLLKKAQKLKGREIRHYARRRMGVIIDSTGWDYERIAGPVKKLRKLGYDCYLVYVHTSLETALKRNELRAKRGGRDVPDSYIETAWRGARRNFQRYVRLFGKPNVMVIDNDKDVEPKTWKSVISPKLRKIARRILDRPLRNPVGKEWLEKQRTAPDLDSPDRPEEWPEEEPPKYSYVTYSEKKPKKGGQGSLYKKAKKGKGKKHKKKPEAGKKSKKTKHRLPAPPPVSPKEKKLKDKVVDTGKATVTFGKKPGILSKLGGVFKRRNEATLEEMFFGIPLDEKRWRDDPKDFRYKLQIEPEKRTKDAEVCTIGKSKKNGKWYGWSHRAYAGFGVGDRKFVSLGRETQAEAPKIRNDAEAKASAAAFAQSVS